MASASNLDALRILSNRLGNRIEEYRDEAGNLRLRCVPEFGGCQPASGDETAANQK